MVMLDKFLQEKNIRIKPPIIKDIKRLIKNIDTQNVKVSNKYDVFNSLAKAFLQIQKHVELLDKMNKKNTDYHKELNILEQFIKYLIELYSFDQDFKKLIDRQNKHTEYKVSNQTFVNDLEVFKEVIEVDKEEKVDLEDLDIEIEDPAMVIREENKDIQISEKKNKTELIFEKL